VFITPARQDQVIGARSGTFRAHADAIGSQEIGNCRAFAEKFRGDDHVGHSVDAGCQVVSGSRRDGRSQDDRLAFAQVALGQRANALPQAQQVRRAVILCGRPDADEDETRPGDRILVIAREAHLSAADVLAEQLVDASLPIRSHAAREAGDPLAVDAARAVIERAREEIRAGGDPGDLAARLREELADARSPRLRRVLNATGVVVHTSAISSYLRTVGRLPVNVKMIVEGEEEIGSEHLEAFLEKYKAKMAAEGIGARVVSMPCWKLFEEQSEGYRREVLGPGTVKVAIEAAAREGWDRYIGSELLGDGGAFIGMSSFGASGPYKDVYAKFGITADAAVAAAFDKLGTLTEVSRH